MEVTKMGDTMQDLSGKTFARQKTEDNEAGELLDVDW